ncbi:hypothetical protein R5R35_005405 [Gryllus longicercus]
MGRWRLL